MLRRLFKPLTEVSDEVKQAKYEEICSKLHALDISEC